jgi:hypothetical protein
MVSPPHSHRMKKILAISMLSMITMPSAIYAFSVEEIIETARAGNGTVVESHSSASTGGQTAASGQSVTTGDVSASSHTETRINANGSGGTVEVKVEKTENGVTTKQDYSKSVEPGEPVHVNVNVEASSDSEAGETTVVANGTTEEPVRGEAEEQSEVATFFAASVPNFFKKVFSFFLWF